MHFSKMFRVPTHDGSLCLLSRDHTRCLSCQRSATHQPFLIFRLLPRQSEVPIPRHQRLCCRWQRGSPSVHIFDPLRFPNKKSKYKFLRVRKMVWARIGQKREGAACCHRHEAGPSGAPRGLCYGPHRCSWGCFVECEPAQPRAGFGCKTAPNLDPNDH